MLGALLGALAAGAGMAESDEALALEEPAGEPPAGLLEDALDMKERDKAEAVGPKRKAEAVKPKPRAEAKRAKKTKRNSQNWPWHHTRSGGRKNVTLKILVIMPFLN